MDRITALLDAVQAGNDAAIAALITTNGAGLGWIRERWQAVVTIGGILAMSFGAGSGTVMFFKDWSRVPERLDAVEQRLEAQHRQWERLRCELIEALGNPPPVDCDRRILR